MQNVRGTYDLYGEAKRKAKRVISEGSKIVEKYGFEEIETPIFEFTEVFSRNLGDTSDIVTKEMYCFEDRGGESLTLRPEGTAGVVRAFISNGMQQNLPVKMYYAGPMFRYERPQKGRQRQFTQFGVELLGVETPQADIEVIAMAYEFVESLGLSGTVTVEINSLGCSECRKEYKEQLKRVIAPFLGELCEDCQNRYEKNPLRILDCKNENCNRLFEEHDLKNKVSGIKLCPECSQHYSDLKKYLDVLNIKYVENTFLVRGLDYYTKTVFEIKSNNLGSQNAVCGGGRYDGLVETLGGAHTPAVGWAMGVERLNSLIPQLSNDKIDYFVVSDNKIEAVKLTAKLREKGFSAEFDYNSRKFAKQLEKAAKTSKCAIILGEDELKNNYLTVKNLETSNQEKKTFEEL